MTPPPPPQLLPSSHLLPFHISPLPPLVTIWDRIGRECMGGSQGAEPESIRNTRCVLHRKCGLFPIRSFSSSILQSLKSSDRTLLLEPSIIFACKLQPIRKPPCSTLRVDEDDGACGECGAAQPPRLPVVIAAWSAWRFYRLSPSPSSSRLFPAWRMRTRGKEGSFGTF